MNDKLNLGPYHLNYFITFLLIIQLFNFVSPVILNNIINLGGDNFRYSHFSFNSNEDMIVDTSAFPVNQERRFFGLKKKW